MELRIPFTTLLKVALFILACAIVIRLRTILVIFVIAALFAVVLDPVKMWLERWMRRGFAIGLIAIVVFSIVAFLMFVVVPETVSESAAMVKKLPQIAKRAAQAWPAGGPYIEALMGDLAKPPRPDQIRQWLPKGMMAIGALSAVFFTVVLILYLLVDGKRLAAWIVTYAPHPQRKKIVRTLDDVRDVIFAYMRGQLITSTLSFIVALTALMLLDVPAALPLAVLAFFGDAVPVAGFLIALAPAVLLAATVSPTAAIAVAATYVGYQMIENYVIAPRVYGRQMELSALAVVLAVAVGGALMGPLGAILMLPFVAAWPAVEKIWLADRLPPDTIAKHEALGEEGGEETAARIL